MRFLDPEVFHRCVTDVIFLLFLALFDLVSFAQPKGNI